MKMFGPSKPIGMNVKVGDGLTYYVGSDRYPYTVARVYTHLKIGVQADISTIVPGCGWGQEWTITLNPEASILDLSRRKNGRWYTIGARTSSGGCFIMGERRRYSDPSF